MTEIRHSPNVMYPITRQENTTLQFINNNWWKNIIYNLSKQIGSLISINVGLSQFNSSKQFASQWSYLMITPHQWVIVIVEWPINSLGLNPSFLGPILKFIFPMLGLDPENTHRLSAWTDYFTKTKQIAELKHQKCLQVHFFAKCMENMGNAFSLVFSFNYQTWNT